MNKTEKMDYAYDAVGSKLKVYGYGHRHIQSLLMFLVLLTLYAVRSVISIAILAMVDNSHNRTDIQVFDWDKQTQDVVISSFYWGYALLQIPAGVMAYHFGAAILISFTMVVNSAACFAIPLVAQFGGWKGICVCRSLMGVTQGCLYPCLHTMLVKWAPVSERGRLSFFVYCGMAVGIVLSQPIGGFMVGSGMNWTSIFYSSGVLTFVIGGLWIAFGSSSPAKHSRISYEEREFIENSTGTSENSEAKRTPWKEFFTSKPVLALWIAHIFCEWGFIIMLVETASFMKSVLGINIQESGLMSGLPFIASWIFGLLSSLLNDYLINKNIVSTLTSRRIWNGIGCWLPAIFLVILCFVPTESKTLSIFIIIIIIGFTGTINVGFMLSYMDLSTNYAGILLSIGNFSSNLVGIAAPISAGYILNGHETDPASWRIVFLMTAAIFFASNLVYIIFMESDEQPWNSLKSQNDTEMVDILSTRTKITNPFGGEAEQLKAN